MNKFEVPYGVSSFSDLRYGNYLYIDKTHFIEKLDNYSSPYKFFLRPRRFGKSLFTTMLSCYYDINQKDNFENLFGGTFIGENPTKYKNSYHILSFNFSGLRTDNKEILEESFTEVVKESLDKFIKDYNLNFEYNKNTFVSSMLNSFFSNVKFEIKNPIYVIIDEYDHFANELLSFQPELFPDIISKTGLNKEETPQLSLRRAHNYVAKAPSFVSHWYEVLKIGTESVVKRIFATGVSPITLDSLTSGFNIADDITRHEDFNEMMGFTHDEVKEIINKTVVKDLDDLELNNLMDTLQTNYNGYLFAEECETRLFNSDMILYYIKSFAKSGKPPKTLIDKNIASDYGKLGKLFELKNRNANTEVLEDIIKGNPVYCELTEQFSLEKNFTKDDFKSLLFYLGMLTIDSSEYGLINLKVPNYAIKGLYFEYFLKVINEAMEYELEVSEIRKAINLIASHGDNREIIKIIEETLNKLSNRDYISFDEKYVKLIFLSYFFLSKIYLVKSEYEVEDGYIDIALLNQPTATPNYFGIIEFKYITKKQYEDKGDALVKSMLADAKIPIFKRTV